MIMLVFVLLCLALFLTFSAFFIRRYFVKRRTVSLGSQIVGENIFMQWQNQAKRQAMEHVIYQKEEEKEDDEGDDLNRFRQKKDEPHED